MMNKVLNLNSYIRLTEILHNIIILIVLSINPSYYPEPEH